MRNKSFWLGTAATLAAALAFLLLYEWIVYKVPVTQIYLPASSWSDEVVYSKQLAAVVQYGAPQGYFGFNESHADIGTFAAWGPAIFWMYAIPGFFFRGQNAFIWCNLFFMVAGWLVFARAARLKVWQQAAFAVVLACLNAPTRYVFSAMQEPLHYALPLDPSLKIMNQRQCHTAPCSGVHGTVLKNFKHRFPHIQQIGEQEIVEIFIVLLPPHRNLPAKETYLFPAAENDPRRSHTGQRQGNFPAVLKFLDMPRISAAGPAKVIAASLQIKLAEVFLVEKCTPAFPLPERFLLPVDGGTYCPAERASDLFILLQGLMINHDRPAGTAGVRAF